MRRIALCAKTYRDGSEILARLSRMTLITLQKELGSASQAAAPTLEASG